MRQAVEAKMTKPASDLARPPAERCARPCKTLCYSFSLALFVVPLRLPACVSPLCPKAHPSPLRCFAALVGVFVFCCLVLFLHFLSPSFLISLCFFFLSFHRHTCINATLPAYCASLVSIFSLGSSLLGLVFSFPLIFVFSLFLHTTSCSAKLPPPPLLPAST